MLVGGRHLGGANDPPVKFTMSIDCATIEQWDVTPGFFLRVFDLPAGRLAGSGMWAALTIQSTPVSGNAPIQTSIEQFDVQDDEATMWGYGEGWQEAEFNTTLGVWRWMSERGTIQIAGPPRPLRITMTIESPLRYFEEAPTIKARAGNRELAAATIDSSRDWTFDVSPDAIAASGGAIMSPSCCRTCPRWGSPGSPCPGSAPWRWG